MSVRPPVFRERVVCSVQTGRASVEVVADLFDVSRSSVIGRLRLKRETGAVNSRPRPSEQDQPDIQQKRQRSKT